MDETDPRPRRHRRPLLGLASAAAVTGVLAGAALVWSGPRDQVALPLASTPPAEVVEAYVAAVNVRDFDTANEIDARPGHHLGRLSRPGHVAHLQVTGSMVVGDTAVVHFVGDFRGGDDSLSGDHRLWGYRLGRGADGRWRIVDEGVA